MQQLGGLDAAFLYMETPQTPMHVAGLTLYDLTDAQKGRFHEAFRDFFKGRVHLIPVFGKRLAKTVLELDHPGWVDAGELDLDYHIRGATLPAPGTPEQLDAWVAAEHAKPLDRSRPMWQFTVIEGLESGQGALYSKVHHAAIDGGAGMVITSALYDLSERPRKVDIPVAPEPPRKPTIAERSILGLHDLAANTLRQQLKLMETVPTVMGQALEGMAELVGGDVEAAGKRLARLSKNVVAPRTPFNVTMGRGRSYASRTLALAKAKAVTKSPAAAAVGAKMNDVVMAVCGGALRRYLAEHDALPSEPLIAFVPVSLRQAGDTTLNNQVLSMNCPIGTNIEDPLERLARITKDAGSRKEVVAAAKETASSDYTLLGAPMLLPGLMQLFGRMRMADVVPQVVNLCISNTMGPPFPLYCDGAQVTNLYPVSIATHGVGLNITVQSYMDNLDFGITCGAKAVPDPERIAALLEEALDELHAAATKDEVEATIEPKAKTQPKAKAKPRAKAKATAKRRTAATKA